MLGARFRIMCADAGLSIDQTEKALHVTPRTVRNWISGREGIPYAPYRRERRGDRAACLLSGSATRLTARLLASLMMPKPSCRARSTDLASNWVDDVPR